MTTRLRSLRRNWVGLNAELRAARADAHAAYVEASAARAALETLRRDVASIADSIDRSSSEHAREFGRVVRILHALHDQEGESRRQLAALRKTEDYELAYTEPEPLVSVLIPTYRNFKMLRDRSLPSVLAQTYRNLEVVVVGDCAPAETAEAIREIGDERVRYWNLPVRGQYPDDPHERWLASGSVPYNEALARSMGRWIAPFADDDAMRPTAIETMLGTVRADRLEGAYGVMHCIPPEGPSFVVGEFPPRMGHLGLQGGIYHGALRIFEHRLSDAFFGLPNDWALVRRTLRAGARWGFVDDVVCDYYPTSHIPGPRADDVPPDG